MNVDWTLNIGNIVTVMTTLLGFGAGAVGLYLGLRNNVTRLAYMIEVFGGRIINVETEMRAMRDVLTRVAVQDERMSSMDQRIQLAVERIDTLTNRVNARLNHVADTHEERDR